MTYLSTDHSETLAHRQPVTGCHVQLCAASHWFKNSSTCVI